MQFQRFLIDLWYNYSIHNFNYVNWYSKGAIFKRPTVLGGIGVGDRHNGIGSGVEAILPINQLPKLLGLDKMQEQQVPTETTAVFNIDGREFMRTVAKYQSEFDKYNTRNVRFSY